MPSIPTYAFPEQRIYPFHIEQLGHLNKYDPGDFHRHDYFEIFLFNEGGGFHYIDFVTVPIQANSVHFVTPGQVHKIARAPESTGFVIIFPTDFIAISPDTNDFLFQFPLFYHKTDQPVLTITPEQFRQLIEAVESMLVESKGNNPQKKRILQSYLHILLCKCQYWFQLQQEAVPTGRSPLFDLFQNLQMAVEKNYATLHQVEDYARLLFMTPRQLNQAAQKYSGKNVSLMIQHRLVIEAKRQLFYSGDTIGQIAEQLGFVDIAHFSKFIKRHTGFTPSWWKNPVTRFGHG